MGGKRENERGDKRLRKENVSRGKIGDGRYDINESRCDVKKASVEDKWKRPDYFRGLILNNFLVILRLELIQPHDKNSSDNISPRR